MTLSAEAAEAANRNRGREDGLLAGDTLLRHPAASPPPRNGSISGPGGREEERRHSADPPRVSNTSTVIRAQ